MRLAKKLALLSPLVLLLFTSCFKDEPGVPPVTPRAEDFIGEYQGKMLISNWGEETMHVRVDNKEIEIYDFPTKSIVTQLVTSADRVEALSSLSQTFMKMKFKALIYGTQIRLWLLPPDLEFEYTVKGKVNKVKVEFHQESGGVWGAVTRLFTFRIGVKSVKLNGNPIADFPPMIFMLKPCPRVSKKPV